MTEDEEFDLLWAEMERITRKVDPQRASKWGLAVAGIIHSSEVPEDEEVLFGKLLCYILRNGSVEWLDAFYREIRKLKVAAGATLPLFPPSLSSGWASSVRGQPITLPQPGIQ